MQMPQGMEGGMPQLPGNVGIALDEYGRPFLVMRDQVSTRPIDNERYLTTISRQLKIDYVE